VGGRAEIFVLLASEDVESDQVDLGVTMLAGLGGRHVNNLAGAVLDDDEAVLAESRALHGVGQRGAGIGGLEGDIMLAKETMLATDLAKDNFVWCSTQARLRELGIAKESNFILLATISEPPRPLGHNTCSAR
jgi:hypothetical protein